MTLLSLRQICKSFGGNYVADNSDGDAAANSRTGSLDALRIFLDIC